MVSFNFCFNFPLCWYINLFLRFLIFHHVLFWPHRQRSCQNRLLILTIDYFGFSTYSITSHTNNEFYFFLFNPNTFYFFLPHCTGETSSSRSCRNNENGHFNLVLDLKGKSFNISPLKTTFAVGLL